MRISEIHQPATVQEVLDLIDKDPDTLILAGGTEIIGSQCARALVLPAQAVSIGKLQELRKTIRTEQFLEIGACTTMTGLLSLSPGTLAIPLPAVIGSLANHAIRNLATVGGNLCGKSRFMDLWPFLLCMDAQIELRSKKETRWASISHLADENGKPGLPASTLLTRIRIPHVTSNFIYYRKLGTSRLPSPESVNFVCSANVRHGKIEEFKLVCSGETTFRARDLDVILTGKKTSLLPKEQQSVMKEYCKAFSRTTLLSPRIFSALLEEAFGRLFG